MTEPPAEPMVSAASKLQIDRPTDFKFHLAYEVYSKAWDSNSSEAARVRLNELISVLASNEDGYPDFYGQIQQYRNDMSYPTSGRTRIQSGRKRQWQRNENRDARNRRHR